jgi:hypothetical protein
MMDMMKLVKLVKLVKWAYVFFLYTQEKNPHQSMGTVRGLFFYYKTYLFSIIVITSI